MQILRGTRTLTLAALAGLLLAVLFSAPAAAQGTPPAAGGSSGAIQVEDDSASSTFGVQARELRFRLRARSAESIRGLTLLYLVDDSSVENAVVPPFQPGTQVTTEYVWRVAGVLTPGSTVSYRWQIETDRGAKHTTTAKSVTFMDTRFEWTEARGENVSVFWHGGSAQIGQQLVEEVRATAAKLRTEFGLSFDRPLKVYAYARADDYASALGIPAREVRNIQAQLLGSDRILVLTQTGNPSAMKAAQEAVRIQAVQALFTQKAEGPYGPPPLWLGRGFAYYTETGALSDNNFKALRQLAQENKLLSFRTLSGSFPSTEDDENLAIAQSISLVKFMYDSYGAEKVAGVFAAFKEGATTDDALKKGLGVTLDQLESRWKNAVKNGSANRPAGQGRPGADVAVPDGWLGTVMGPTIQSWSGVFGSYAPLAVIGAAAFVGLGLIAVIAGTFISAVRRARRETEEA